MRKLGTAFCALSMLAIAVFPFKSDAAKRQTQHKKRARHATTQTKPKPAPKTSTSTTSTGTAPVTPIATVGSVSYDSPLYALLVVNDADTFSGAVRDGFNRATSRGIARRAIVSTNEPSASLKTTISRYNVAVCAGDSAAQVCVASPPAGGGLLLVDSEVPSNSSTEVRRAWFDDGASAGLAGFVAGNLEGSNRVCLLTRTSVGRDRLRRTEFENAMTRTDATAPVSTYALTDYKTEDATKTIPATVRQMLTDQCSLIADTTGLPLKPLAAAITDSGKTRTSVLIARVADQVDPDPNQFVILTIRRDYGLIVENELISVAERQAPPRTKVIHNTLGGTISEVTYGFDSKALSATINGEAKTFEQAIRAEMKRLQ